MSIEQFPTASGSSGTVTSVAGGVGITNTPEPIVGAGTVDLDINSLTTEPNAAADDYVAILDTSVGTAPSAQRKTLIEDLYTGNDIRRLAWTQYQGGGTTSTATPDVGSSASAQSSTTTTAFQDSTGAYIDLATNGAIADTNGIVTGPGDQTARILQPVFYMVFKTGTAITSLRAWFIFADATGAAPYNSDDPAGVNLIGFRYLANSPSAGVNETTWKFVTKDATTLNVIDTLVTVATNTRYVFKVDARTSPVLGYINGTLVATTSTNLPTNTAGLKWFTGIRSRDTVVRSFRFAKVLLRHN